MLVNFTRFICISASVGLLKKVHKRNIRESDIWFVHEYSQTSKVRELCRTESSFLRAIYHTMQYGRPNQSILRTFVHAIFTPFSRRLRLYVVFAKSLFWLIRTPIMQHEHHRLVTGNHRQLFTKAIPTAQIIETIKKWHVIYFFHNFYFKFLLVRLPELA